jgi:hypothetical protein
MAQRIAEPNSMIIKPWTRWWWMGNAVDTVNLKHHLQQFKEVGIGGVEITPIYGVKGYEDQFIPYLSKEWMKMLDYTCTEAEKLGLGVDINNGTGWPFGGPQISKETAARKVGLKITIIASRKERKTIIKEIQKDNEASQDWQALNIIIHDQSIPLYPDIDTLKNFLSQNKSWPMNIYTLHVNNTMQRVKRAAPGGEGLVMDHFSREGIHTYLSRFDTAFDFNRPENLRAVFNDSYEVYGADWTTKLLDEFRTKRGYDLSVHLPYLAGDGDIEIVKRVRADYRQTIADLILEYFTIPWHNWAQKYGLLSRNQAHGSPGNLIDLYATADIPEIEIFGYSHFDLTEEDRSQLPILRDTTDFLMLKFASSAANLDGKNLVSSESFTWLRDHFKVGLSDIKPEADQLFTAGVNHLFFHGTTYSPKDDQWPGWLFYASTHFNPSTSWWKDLRILNEYIATCQNYLQNSKPDNDILLYWPIADVWGGEYHNLDASIFQQLSIHNLNEWLKPSPFHQIASWLNENGYSFDYVSDAFLNKVKCENGKMKIGGYYKAILVPPCQYIPLETQKKLCQLSNDGVNVIYIDELPRSVPGFKDFKSRENVLFELQEKINPEQIIPLDQDRVIDDMLTTGGMRKELIVLDDINYIRKRYKNGYLYFLANLSSSPYLKWTSFAVPSRYVTRIDPMNGRSGVLESRKGGNEEPLYLIDMIPGESCILIFSDSIENSQPWINYTRTDDPMAISNEWAIEFVSGGPVLPGDTSITNLISWTDFKDNDYREFSGTAKYVTYFDKPEIRADAWLLEFDQIKESARIRINGKEIGTIIARPWQILIPDKIRKNNNELQVEVTNLDANRIRSQDGDDPSWKKFHDINFVDIHYEHFDASHWELTGSGLIGEVRLVPLKIKVQ